MIKHERVHVELLQSAEHGDAVAVGQLDVADGHIEIAFAGLLECFFRRRRHLDIKAPVRQKLLQALTDNVFVFDD